MDRLSLQLTILKESSINKKNDNSASRHVRQRS
jgi:hypothetical protein